MLLRPDVDEELQAMGEVGLVREAGTGCQLRQVMVMVSL
jgi:hypothetical protein